jgi:hypothetical protein
MKRKERYIGTSMAREASLRACVKVLWEPGMGASYVSYMCPTNNDGIRIQ